MRKISKATLGKIIVFISILFPLVALVPVMFIENFLELLRESLAFILYLAGFGVVMLVGVAFGASMWIGALSLSKARVFVVSRDKNDVRGTLVGTVILETEQGEKITIRANTAGYNSLLEGYLGVIHYRLIKDKIAKFAIKPLFKSDEDGVINEFVKFEFEGKSANPDGTRLHEHCKSCNAIIRYDKFSTQTECRYCVDGNMTSNQSITKHEKNSKTRLGNFLMRISVITLVMCVFFLIFIPLLRWDVLRGLMVYLIIGCVFSIVIWLLGRFMWFRALPAIKVRVLVKSLNKSGVAFGNVTFETEQSESIALLVDIESYNLISEGDIGILSYKLNEKNEDYFLDFENEGKSAALTELESNRCKKCGGVIQIERYKFNTEIICEYCSSIN